MYPIYNREDSLLADTARNKGSFTTFALWSVQSFYSPTVFDSRLFDMDFNDLYFHVGYVTKIKAFPPIIFHYKFTFETSSCMVFYWLIYRIYVYCIWDFDCIFINDFLLFCINPLFSGTLNPNSSIEKYIK